MWTAALFWIRYSVISITVVAAASRCDQIFLKAFLVSSEFISQSIWINAYQRLGSFQRSGQQKHGSPDCTGISHCKCCSVSTCCLVKNRETSKGNDWSCNLFPSKYFFVKVKLRVWPASCARDSFVRWGPSGFCVKIQWWERGCLCNCGNLKVSYPNYSPYLNWR